MSRKFQCKVVPSTWLQDGGRRLDCGPYLSGAIEARELLRKLQCVKDPLQKITSGIYHAGRESRLWVESADYGVPFMGSTDILASDLSNLPLISKKQVQANPQFTIKEGWTLITRSGTIGRMAYARSDMDGLACSEHVMRIVPDRSNVKPGYVYAYLSGRFGVPLVISGTYGSIIQSIEPHHIVDLPVPRLGKVEDQAHKLVQQAADNRTEAACLLQESKEKIIDMLRWLPERAWGCSSFECNTVSSTFLQARCDGFYYEPRNMEARLAFDRASTSYGAKMLGDVGDVFIPGIFRRVYADDPNCGYPYFTGSDMYQLNPITDQYLSKQVAEEYRLILRRGMILIQDSGQIYGILGQPTIVGQHLDGATCTNNMIRITASDVDDNGYLFALLSSEPGLLLMKREASGSSIPHLSEDRVRQMEIPWPEKRTRRKFSSQVWKAVELREEAIDCERKAQALVEHTIEKGGR